MNVESSILVRKICGSSEEMLEDVKDFLSSGFDPVGLGLDHDVDAVNPYCKNYAP